MKSQETSRGIVERKECSNHTRWLARLRKANDRDINQSKQPVQRISGCDELLILTTYCNPPTLSILTSTVLDFATFQRVYNQRDGKIMQQRRWCRK